MKEIDFEAITLRCDYSSRGGGIEISLDTLGFKGMRMTAYQNYLGGGLLGSIASDCTIRDWEEHDKLKRIADQLRKYFHSLTNPDSEWEGMSYEQNQRMPASAY
jgi:hypothetical protein